MNIPPAANRFSVGLTGGIGSGKSLVADMFAARGAGIIDTDQIAHRLTASGGLAIPHIRSVFGSSFLTAEGAMDRPEMRKLVFADAQAKKQLESILHPLISCEAQRAASGMASPYLIYVVPLLVESGKWKQRVSRVLVVDCPEEMQLARVTSRSKLTESETRAIISTQASRESRLAAADDIIVNDGEIAALEPQVDKLHGFYLVMAAKS